MTSAVVPSGSVAVAVSCTVCPAAVNTVVAAPRESVAGTGAGVSKSISGTWMTPSTGTVKNSDCPERVTPLSTQVARTRTWPRLAGTLGSTHEPSASTCVERLRALTVQD